MTPRRMLALVSRVRRRAVGVDDPGVGRGALGDEAQVVDEPGLDGAGLPRLLLGQHIGQQADGLDVAAAPAVLRRGDDADALGRPGLGGGAVDAAWR